MHFMHACSNSMAPPFVQSGPAATVPPCNTRVGDYGEGLLESTRRGFSLASATVKLLRASSEAVQVLQPYDVEVAQQRQPGEGEGGGGGPSRLPPAAPPRVSTSTLHVLVQ